MGTANGLPDDESLAAFGDRFLIHVFVDPLPDHQLETMLSGGWRSDQTTVLPEGGLAHLDTLSGKLKEVQLDEAHPALANAIGPCRFVSSAIKMRPGARGLHEEPIKWG